MTKLKDGHPLTDYVRRSEAEMGRFLEGNHVELDYDNFIRVGVPLLHGVMKNEIHPGSWLQYCGGENVELRILKGDKVYISIPPLHAPQPTVTYEDPNFPGFGEQHTTLSYNRQDNPESFDTLISELIAARLPDPGMDDTFLDQINYVFEENGFEPFDKTLIETKAAVAQAEKPQVVKEEEKASHENKRVDGDLL